MKLKVNPNKSYPILRDGEVVGHVHVRKDENGFLRIVEQCSEISSVDPKVITRKEVNHGKR